MSGILNAGLDSEKNSLGGRRQIVVSLVIEYYSSKQSDYFVSLIKLRN